MEEHNVLTSEVGLLFAEKIKELDDRVSDLENRIKALEQAQANP